MFLMSVYILLAGMRMNLYEADAIYRDMARYRTYPEGLFTGSEATLRSLREAIAREHARSLRP